MPKGKHKENKTSRLNSSVLHVASYKVTGKKASIFGLGVGESLKKNSINLWWRVFII